MRRPFVVFAGVLFAALSLLAAGCSDGTSDTATTGDDTGGGVVVEGVVDDGTGSGDEGSVDDANADGGDVTPLPDIDDLALDEPTFTYEVTGDPCTDMETLVVGPTAQALAEQSDEEQQAVFLYAAEPFGDEAVAAVEALIEAGDTDIGEDEFVELFAALDEVTLEPCGWPLYGALFAIAEAAPVMFCETSEALDAADDGFEPAQERCDQDGIAPSTLPCFDERDADVDSDLFFRSRWETVDCDSGEPVDWDGQVGEWVVTTEAAPGPGEAIPVPAPAEPAG